MSPHRRLSLPPVRNSQATPRLRLISSIAVALMICLMCGRDANAQYMYLDTNGDGVHTTADVLTAVGTTSFDVWLRTNTNRDGSPAVCVNAGGPLSIFSYVVRLQAVSGKVNWITTENLMVSMGLQIGDAVDGEGYFFAYAGLASYPPGDYKLARFSVSVSEGTPSIEIVRSGSIHPTEMTSFGSACLGRYFENTIQLGVDWFDVDGLPYSSAGGVNLPPTILGPGRLSVMSGETGSADFEASDPEGDVVVIELTGAPPFASFAPLASGPASASIRVYSAPGRGDAGSFLAQVRASDGTDVATQVLEFQVLPGPDHPPSLFPISALHVGAGSITSVPLSARDTDGDPVGFDLVEAPAFVSVRTLRSGRAATTGQLLLRPGPCDVGSHSLRLRAVTTDGSDEQVVPVVVAASTAPNPPLVRNYPEVAAAVAGADFNADGFQDVAFVSGLSGSVLEVFLGDGTGELRSSWAMPVARGHVCLDAADWNGDGRPDLATGSVLGQPLEIYWGRGDGSFDAPTIYPDLQQINEVRGIDLNGDGLMDLVAASEGSNIHILLGTRNGSPVSATPIRVEGTTKDLSLGDFNLDGELDIAAAVLSGAAVRVYYGHPDGRFGPGPVIATGDAVYGLVVGDWDEDGLLDLAGTRAYNDGALVLMRGTTDGSFVATSHAGPYHFGFDVSSCDWNGDGHLDLVPAADAGTLGIRILFGAGDGTFTVAVLAAGLDVGWEVSCADLNGDGRSDLVWGGGLTTVLNATPWTEVATSRAFLQNANRTIPLVPASGSPCVRVEPTTGAFDATDIDPASVRMVSVGTGTVSEIRPLGGKTAVSGDTDGNGVAEYAACFRMEDLRQLLSQVRGKLEVAVNLEGRLMDGRWLCSHLLLPVVGMGGDETARVEPNPLNPTGLLRFTIAHPGAVTIRIFDATGRLVRTVWNARPTVAGPQQARLDGSDAAGRPLRSGVYFYRIEAPGLSTTGRFTVLR